MLAFKIIGTIFLILAGFFLFGLKMWLWMETPMTEGTNRQRIKFKTFIAMYSMAPNKWKWSTGDLVYYTPDLSKNRWYNRNTCYEFYFTGLDIIRFYNWRQQRKLNEKKKADYETTARILQYWQQDIENNKAEARRQLEVMMNKNTYERGKAEDFFIEITTKNGSKQRISFTR